MKSEDQWERVFVCVTKPQIVSKRVRESSVVASLMSEERRAADS